MSNLLSIFWNLVVESAPWLLLGYFIAGVIKQVIPSEWVQKQLAKPGLLSITKGALIGAPLPLCSCGVIPTALAVRKAGASKGATASFLVATPETGVDSIAFSYAMLGPIFAIARPISALISAVIAGVLVHKFDTDDVVAEPAPATKSCCSMSKPNAEPEPPTLGERLVQAVQYGYGRMIADTAKWLFIGLTAAALVTAYVPQSFFLQWGDGVIAMLIMVIVGLPMYICATASTPVAASFLFAGLSPGAALVFMLTGPATNIATMGVIREQLGNRSLVAYLIGVIATAITAGLVLNQLYGVFGWELELAAMSHGEETAPWRQIAAIALSLLVVRVWVNDLQNKLRPKTSSISAVT
jgi:uncharacterized membrane protein YraQ (UPF0718 family)